MRARDLIWPVIGVGAAVFSGWLLWKDLRSLSFDDLVASLAAISWVQWLFSAGGAVVAYAALAAYDQLALRHLGKRLSWLFVSVTSFTTYALSHNIGASMFSGAVVRYRAYSTKGLTGYEVGILVAFCSFTFVLGTAVAAGVLLVIEPEVLQRFHPDLPIGAALGVGVAILAAVWLYVFGSLRHFKPAKIGPLTVVYPRPEIVVRQLVIAPIEILGATAIIYFALPVAGNPGFMVILGIFVVSFSAALVSHAPGGLGVLEFVFLAGLHEMAEADVLAALLVFRLLYLLIPFAVSIGVVFLFEHRQVLGMLGRRVGPKP